MENVILHLLIHKKYNSNNIYILKEFIIKDTTLTHTRQFCTQISCIFIYTIFPIDNIRIPSYQLFFLI